jgi:hypothetical protein
MISNEHEGTRNLLRRSTTTPVPAGLENQVLLRIAELADKKAKKRAALSGLLRYTSIGLVLIAVAQALLPGVRARTIVSATANQVTENAGEKIVWLLQNTYFLVPLLGFYVLTRLYRLKAG